MPLRLRATPWAWIFYGAVLANLIGLSLAHVDGHRDLIPLGIVAIAINVTILFVVQARGR